MNPEQEIALQLKKNGKRLAALEAIESWHGKTAAVAHAVSMMQHLPGIRGVWPMSAIDSAGNAIDVSGQGRTLTYNGNPTYNVYDDFVPYIDLDGAGDYLSRSDEAGLDILGTETYVAAAMRGLTLGGWFWLDALPGANNPSFIGKIVAAGNQRSYALQTGALDVCRFIVSNDGTVNPGFYNNIDSELLATSSWYFMAGRFIPSTEIAVFLNEDKRFDTRSIIASIFNSTSPLEIGGRSDTAVYINGRASLCFLSVEALSDDWIKYIFDNTRNLFGV